MDTRVQHLDLATRIRMAGPRARVRWAIVLFAAVLIMTWLVWSIVAGINTDRSQGSAQSEHYLLHSKGPILAELRFHGAEITLPRAESAKLTVSDEELIYAWDEQTLTIRAIDSGWFEIATPITGGRAEKVLNTGFLKIQAHGGWTTLDPALVEIKQ